MEMRTLFSHTSIFNIRRGLRLSIKWLSRKILSFNAFVRLTIARSLNGLIRHVMSVKTVKFHDEVPCEHSSDSRNKFDLFFRKRSVERISSFVVNFLNKIRQAFGVGFKSRFEFFR